MISFAPIVAQLKAAGFNYVEGVIEFAAMTDVPRQTPALFIVPQADTASPNTLSAGAVDQRVSDVFSIVLVEEAKRVIGAASEALVEGSHKVEQALTGWQHPDASSPCQFVGGRLLSTQGHRIAWSMSFSLPRRIRKVG
jgi:hypothetical protein